jgi:hypothetical protein
MEGQNLALTLKRLWKNEYFKTAVTIALIPLLVAGFWFGLQLALNTKIFPLFTVTSNSMCIPPGPCDGLSHPFERTLHIGDLLVIQGIDPKSFNANYPNSDVIVFQKPDMPANNPDSNIVHRIVSKVEINGTLYFYTKGDGNGYPNVWPNPVTTAIDTWMPDPSNPSSTHNGAVSQDYVYGKVVMRIPWVGSLSLLAQQYTFIPVILVIIIILLVIMEFVLPLLRPNNDQTTSKAN